MTNSFGKQSNQMRRQNTQFSLFEQPQYNIKNNEPKSVEELIGTLLKRVLVFSSKIKSLKKKILKANPNFSSFDIFREFSDPKTHKMNLEDLNVL